MTAKKKESDLTFERMYGKLEIPGMPEKVSGQPVARSSRLYLEELKKQTPEGEGENQ